MNSLLAVKKRAGQREQREVYLSALKPVGFEESTLALNGVVLKTDAYSWIQEVLIGGYITVHWDLAVSLSDTLLIESGTSIITSTGKGAVLRAGVNKPMFRNRNIKFSNNSTIIDKDITFNGGIWNGNGANQNRKGTPESGASTIFSWFGVKNLTLSNHKMYTPKTYAQQAINIENGHLLDFVVDVGLTPSINMDGVHFDGWCNNCSIKRGNIRSYDDGVGVNADDLYTSPGYGDGHMLGFYPVEAGGPSSNILIEDIVFVDSLFGVRVLSGASRVDNITIRNISGTTYNYSILIDNYFQAPNVLSRPGKGNMGTIIVDNVTTTVPTKAVTFPVNRGKIALSTSIEVLTMTNITPTGTELPMISKLTQSLGGEYTYVYGNVTLNGTAV